MRLHGKTALITGATSKIGEAIAYALAEAGAGVIVGYSSRPTRANDIADEIRLTGGWAITSDFTVDQIEPGREDNISILVNCAGVTAGRSIKNMSDVEWNYVLDVNLTGAMRMTRAVLPWMIEQKQGSIINIASVVGLDGRLGPSSYAASKAGLVGFTKACAHEVARHGVTVNAVAPGFIGDTGMLNGVPEKLRDDVLKQIPVGRFGTVRDIAQAVLYLATAEYVTGTVLNVSGGYTT